MIISYQGKRGELMNINKLDKRVTYLGKGDVYNSMPKNKHKKCYDGRLFKYRGLLFGIGHFRLINYKKTPQPQTINWILYIQEKNAWNKDINFNLYGCMLYDKNEPFAEHKGIINSINYYVRNKEVNKLIDKIIIKENSR